MKNKDLLKNSSPQARPQANLGFKIYITSVYQETPRHKFKVVMTWLYFIELGRSQHKFLYKGRSLYKDGMHPPLWPHKTSTD